MPLNQHKLSKQGNGARDPAELGHAPRQQRPNNHAHSSATNGTSASRSTNDEGSPNVFKESFQYVVQGGVAIVKSVATAINELGAKIIETAKKPFQ